MCVCACLKDSGTDLITSSQPKRGQNKLANNDQYVLSSVRAGACVFFSVDWIRTDEVLKKLQGRVVLCFVKMNLIKTRC